MTREILLESFAPYLELNYKSPQTIKTYFSMGCRFIHDNSKIDRMTKGDINAYLIKYKKGHAIRTYNVMCSVVKMIFSGVLNQTQKTNHLKFIKPPNSLIEVLSVEEISQTIGNTSNLKHRAIMCALYHTLARKSEFLNIRRRNITKQIHDGNIHYGINIISGKGSKGRSIPIPYECAKILSDYVQKYNPQDYLFENEGKRYSEGYLSKVLKNNYAGSKRIYPHLFRHSAATHLVDNGIQIVKLKELLGHSSLKSTMLYVHLSNRSLFDIVRPSILKIAA